MPKASFRETQSGESDDDDESEMERRAIRRSLKEANGARSSKTL